MTAYVVEASTLSTVVQQFVDEAVGVEGFGDVDAEDDSGYIIAITELLSVVVLASLKSVQWSGKIVLYAGDNQTVISWLDRRNSRHPVGLYLLQVLAAIEAAHSFRVHGAYLRTYHNITADDLTRRDPQEVMAKAGLTEMQNPSEHLWAYLQRGWVKRALVWSCQTDEDRAQAYKLAERRGTNLPAQVETRKPLLRVMWLDVREGYRSYDRAAQERGAVLLSQEWEAVDPARDPQDVMGPERWLAVARSAPGRTSYGQIF